ncbi:MogA/MoaB family molybdenum cofactor biosynthesis protein [Oscillospiraceae bacterium WX1]
MYQSAVITVSDSAFLGLRDDTGGPLVCHLLKDAGYDVTYTCIIPDDQVEIEAALIYCADILALALVVTTGGTGFSSRDVTPEATLAVCPRLVPGIPEAMRREGLSTTSRAMLSRQQAGIRGQTLVINLPGSPKAIRENLAVCIPALRHGLDKLLSKTGDCAAPE